MPDGYNGWTNYATWAVKLWIDNEEPAYNYWREQALAAIRFAPEDDRVTDKIWAEEEAARFNLAEQLKDELEDAMPDLGASVWADLLSSALSEVNWNEIARAMIDEVKE